MIYKPANFENLVFASVRTWRKKKKIELQNNPTVILGSFNRLTDNNTSPLRNYHYFVAVSFKNF